VLYLNIPNSFSKFSSGALKFAAGHPNIVHEAGIHLVAHSFNSYIRSGRNLRISRHLRRKTINQKRRWFVDNIIMHHKRLHDNNRQIAIRDARKRSIAKNLNKKKFLTPELDQEKKLQNRAWQQRILIKEQITKMRGRIDSAKVRARTRWLSISNKNN
jgi:hypothetical protein